MSPRPISVSAPPGCRRDGARVYLRGDLEGNAARQVGFDDTGDDVHARAPVASQNRWIPAARANCARQATRISMSAGSDHRQVGQLVDNADNVGKFFAPPISQIASSASRGTSIFASRRVPQLHSGVQFLGNLSPPGASSCDNDLALKLRCCALRCREHVVFARPFRGSNIPAQPAPFSVRSTTGTNMLRQVVERTCISTIFRIHHDEPPSSGLNCNSGDTVMALIPTVTTPVERGAMRAYGIFVRSTISVVRLAYDVLAEVDREFQRGRIGPRARFDDLAQAPDGLAGFGHFSTRRSPCRAPERDAHTISLERQREIFVEVDDFFDAHARRGRDFVTR